MFSLLLHAYVYVFVLRSLSGHCNDWPNAINTRTRLCAVSFSRFFFLLLLFLYWAQVNERRRKRRANGPFPFIQTNNVDSVTITNVFYHLICQLACHTIFFLLTLQFVLMSIKKCLLQCPSKKSAREREREKGIKTTSTSSSRLRHQKQINDRCRPSVSS
jgi:hypothetical protein